MAAEPWRSHHLRAPSSAGQPELVEREALGHGAAGIGGMHDGERKQDGAGPGRDSIRETERQEGGFGRDVRAIPSGEQAEEAEVNLDVAIGRLNAAEFQDAVSQTRHGRVIRRQSAQLQRGIGLDGGADLGWAGGVDIESAVGKLPVENGAHRFGDERRGLRLPLAVLRRVEPELEQDVIGFERGVGRQFGAPVTVFGLEASHVSGGAIPGPFGSALEGSAGLWRRAH